MLELFEVQQNMCNKPLLGGLFNQLLAILLLGAEFICTKKGSVSRKCSPCPESDPDCPRPPGMYGNYVNISQLNLTFREIIYNYRKQPQCKPQVFCGVFIDWSSTRRNGDEFLKRKEAINSEGGDIMSNQDEFNLWLEVIGGKNKKGRIYGLGSEDYIGSSSTPPSVHSTVDPEMIQMKEEVASLKSQNEMIMSALQAFGIPLPNVSNLATNDEAPQRDNENDS